MISAKTLANLIAVAAIVTFPLTSNASLIGRNLDGNTATYEAYYDTVLNISWLADANYANTSGYDVQTFGYDTGGLMSGQQAKTWANGLQFFGISGWRLPDTAPVNGVNFNANSTNNGTTDFGFNIKSTQSELAYMFYVNLGNLGACTPSWNTSSCDPQAGSGLTNSGPFANLAHSNTNVYWSESNFNQWNQFYFGMQRRTTVWKSQPWPGGYVTDNFDGDQGAVSGTDPYFSFYAWAVHAGDVGLLQQSLPDNGNTVPEPASLMLVGLGLAGISTARRRKCS